MIEQINTELLKLQDELNKFDGAVAKIAQAGEITDTLIESSKNLQESFGEQLEKIQGLFSDYMNKTYNHTESKINRIFEHFQERLKQEEEALEKFNQLSDQNTNLTQEFLEKTTEESSKQVNNLITEANNNLEEQKDYIKLQMNDLQKSLTKMMESHNEKIKSEQTMLDNYLELANSTAELSKFLKTVDFPTKLDSIQEQVTNLKEENRVHFDDLTKLSTKTNANSQKLVDDNTNINILDKVKKIYANDKSAETLQTTKHINSRVRGTKFFVILIFIMTIIFYAFFAFAFFNFFPHFFEDIL